MSKSNREIEKLLNFNGVYDTYETIDDPNGTIHVFNNVILGNRKSENIVCLNGTYSVFTCVAHYFHFLKEYFAFHLYYKNNYDPGLKYLWMDHSGFHYPSYQNMLPVCDFVFDGMDISEGVRFPDTEMGNTAYLIEKLVVMFDSQKYIVTTNVKQSDYNGTPGLNKELREFYMKYAVKDESLPKKIFLTRKIVSQELPNHPGNTEAQYSWKRDQLRLRYNPPWLEDAIEQFFIDEGYELVQLSGMTIPEQVNFFYNASHVAGLLGTAFYNGIFSRQWTKFTAVRVTPSYWYDFEGDIQSVVNVKFDYANVYEHVDTEQVREFLTQTLKSRGRTI
jgi:hypothetical protein